MKTARSLEAAEMHANAIEKNETSENNNPENNFEFEELSAFRQHRKSRNKRRTEPDWVKHARKQEQQHNRKSPADPTCYRCGEPGARMRLSDPHNMLSKIAVKRKFLPCRNPTLVPTIITQECPFNSMVSPQHCSLLLVPASTCSLNMSIRRSNNKDPSYYLHQHVSIHMVAANHSRFTVDALGKRSLVEFVIVNHKDATILGRDTSVAMGVLHVGSPSHPTRGLYKLASEQENTANTVHTDPPTPNVVSPPHPDHPATIDQNPIPELHSLPTSLRLHTILSKYHQVFEGLGRVKGVEVEIHVKKGTIPVVHPPSRAPGSLARSAE